MCSRKFPELDRELDPELEPDFGRPLLELDEEILDRLLLDDELPRLAELELFCELGRLSMTAPRSVSILTFSRLYPRSWYQSRE